MTTREELHRAIDQLNAKDRQEVMSLVQKLIEADPLAQLRNIPGIRVPDHWPLKFRKIKPIKVEGEPVSETIDSGASVGISAPSEGATKDLRMMSSSFEPRLDILPESQQELWPELDAVPSDFVLYGGTALALQLGHRVSEDFDFFSSSGFDSKRLQSRLPFFRDLDPAAGEEVWVHHKRDNLEGYVTRQGVAVKVAFFGGLSNLRRVEDPRRPINSRVQVASLVDLAGMKMRVIQMRGSWKDYADIHALVSHGIDIATGLAAARAIDSGFQPEISIRALQFYGDGTSARVPVGVQRDLTRWAQSVDLAKLPHLPSRQGLTPEGLGR